ncbi:head-tail connector protein [Mechercharimyces sp. CAU 1602]|uniref:head-tail connector protein n=1 Tax=Mechercharimyces sp. CAU 1602 TaxID=2973933 RepID=UPI0021617953|nr:head-tail connector protein [Mechercharimyces sp. CAU 1602]MCS1351152.1 head-tail connector protein [Mechercharimyces sp. CAU 1602]
MKPSSEEVKQYLRIDGGEDDVILALLIDGAVEYLRNAGIEEIDSKLYMLAVMLYVALNYEHRDGADKVERFSYALESIIGQLRV